MFPNNVPYIARERDRERYQEADQIRLIKIAKLNPDYREGIVRRAAAWLGRQMIQLGIMLQSYGSVPVPEVSPVETAN